MRPRLARCIAQKADVNAALGDGMTALHWAAFKDDVELVRALVAAGAAVSPETRIGGITPILLAATNGNAAMIDVLLKAGADAGIGQDQWHDRADAGRGRGRHRGGHAAGRARRRRAARRRRRTARRR